MPIRRLVIALALALAFVPSAFSAQEHKHDGHSHSHELRLDNGKKWRTDAALRKGMNDIRTTVADALPRVHRGQFGAADFTALADRIERHVDYVVTNCKLSAEADAQLHIALDHILDGVAAMKANAGQAEGVVAVVQALDAYAKHFDHPAWKAIKHSERPRR